MNADMIPTPATIVIVLLIEFLYGLAYNALWAWAQKYRFMHVSISVAIGVTSTLLIPAVAWFDLEMQFWQAGILLMLCFTASGVPMIVGSTRRTMDAAKDHKKRRPWPTAAMRVRDDVVMDLMSLAHEIAERAKANELTVRDLPDYVNRLHSAIGTLKSV